MPAAVEELARRAPHELVALVNEEWAKRYGRAARLGKNPSKPKRRIKETGDDARLLLRYVHRYLPALRHGEQVQSLRQIVVRCRGRTGRPAGRAGPPPAAAPATAPARAAAGVRSVPTSRHRRSTVEYSHPPERPNRHIGHARPGHINKIVLRARRVRIFTKIGQKIVTQFFRIETAIANASSIGWTVIGTATGGDLSDDRREDD